ncbi:MULTISPECIES: hypothetical protein [unclassified Microcoleus]|uniref:hypothetical protein n=1 Tax=unclassified Microcoleus TaxID=2642155 RepID=UPI002FD0C78A
MPSFPDDSDLGIGRSVFGSGLGYQWRSLFDIPRFKRFHEFGNSGQLDRGMPVDRVLPTVLDEAGSKHQTV